MLACMGSQKQKSDDFKIRRMIAKAAVHTHFAEPWQWRVEIDKVDGDLFRRDASGLCLFDYLAKGVNFCPVEFGTDPLEVGATVFTFPTTAQSVAVLMTVRDSADRKLYTWFSEISGKVNNPDGTFNLPFSYLLKMTIYAKNGDTKADEIPQWEGTVYPQKMGDITEEVDAEGFIEFPIIFQQFCSTGGL